MGTKMVRQRNGVAFVKDEWRTSETDPDGDKYAILDELESCRSSSGGFTMKLSWPESDLEDIIWTQTSNPVTTTSGGVEGYDCVCSECSCPYTSQYWGGLEYNNANTLLDGSASHGHWYYGVGGISSGAIHGPDSRLSGQVVELYALC